MFLNGHLYVPESISENMLFICDSLFISHLVEHGSLLDLDSLSALINRGLIRLEDLPFISR